MPSFEERRASIERDIKRTKQAAKGIAIALLCGWVAVVIGGGLLVGHFLAKVW